MNLSQIYSFPVVNRGGKFTGLVTDRDIFDKVKMYQTIESSESGIAYTGLDDDIYVKTDLYLSNQKSGIINGKGKKL